MTDCLFCNIINGDVPSSMIYEDERVLVFKDIAPKAEVHLLAIPREHIESLNSLTAEHDELIGYMARLLAKLAKEQGLDTGFRTIINTGKGGGQIVFHLHMHLLGGPSLPGFE